MGAAVTIRRVRPDLMLALDEDTPICGAHRAGPRSTRCEFAPDHLVPAPGEPVKADADRDPNGFRFHVGRAPSGRYLDWPHDRNLPDVDQHEAAA